MLKGVWDIDGYWIGALWSWKARAAGFVIVSN